MGLAAHISTFIDRPIKIGRDAIGSPNIIDLNVTREKLARSAVGSGQHGTLNLAKAVGTLSSVDIGSAVFSYGSAGTFAGGLFRGRSGSFRGTAYGHEWRSRRVIALTGSFQGTAYARYFRGIHGSFTGTVTAAVARGGHGSFGTMSGQFVRSRYGSFRGSLSAPQFDGRFGSFAGTVRGAFVRGGFGSFGTMAGQVVRSRAGSFLGTVYGHRFFGSVGSFSRVPSSIGSFGTAAAQVFRSRYGSFIGTIIGPRTRVTRLDVGSSDTQIVRGGAGVIQANARFFARRTNATDVVINSRTTADSQNRYTILTNGKMTWGPGSNTATDVTLARNGSSNLLIGSHVTLKGYGSAGTLIAKLFRTGRFVGSVGSFTRVPLPSVVSGQGSFGTLSSRIHRFQIGSLRSLQALGTHLAGSLTAASLVARYAVWPTAFPNANYRPSLQIQARAGLAASNAQDYYLGAYSRSPGSLQYYVGNANAALSRPPPGSVFITGMGG